MVLISNSLLMEGVSSGLDLFSIAIVLVETSHIRMMESKEKTLETICQFESMKVQSKLLFRHQEHHRQRDRLKYSRDVKRSHRGRSTSRIRIGHIMVHNQSKRRRHMKMEESNIFRAMIRAWLIRDIRLRSLLLGRI